MIADTAQLIVDLRLNDQLSGPITAASSKVSALAGASGLGGLSGVASKVESAMGKVGNALSHAGSQISGLVKNIGLFGGAIALFSVGGALKGAIDTANTMAKSIETLTGLTGEDATTVSKLLAVFERFGVSADTATTRLAFMEKTLGTLSLNQKSLTKLEQEFGISLTDSSGNIVDVNTALQRLADYMNSGASAADKAALASKLLGRGYVDLLPVLSQGSAGIAAVEAQAQSLGNTLNQTQVDQLMQYQTAMRNLGEAMQGLELQIAVALVPALTDLAQNLTNFVTTNKDQIIGFFQGAAKFAEQMGSAVEHDVVPAIRAIVSWWNGLPGPLKDFLITAFVAGKVSKFLFDVNIPGTLLTLGVKWAAQALAGLAGDVLGFATGGAVAAGEIEAGMATGGATAAGEISGAMATGGVGIAAAIAGAVGAAGVALGALFIANKISDLNGTSTQDIINNANKAPPGTNIGWNLPFGIGANVVPSPIAGYGTPGFFGGNPAPSMIAAASQGVAGGTGGNVGQDTYAVSNFAAALMLATTWAGNWTSALQKSERAADKQFQAGKNLGSSADTITSYFQSLSSAYFDPSKTGIANLTKEITRFKDEAVMEAKHGNTTLAAKLEADAAKLQAIKDKLAGTNSDLSTTNSLLHALNAKKTTFISNLYADLSVTVRSQQTQNFRSNLYGRSIAV